MNVTEYLKATYDKDRPYLTRKRVYCKDGFNVSIQGGSSGLYCSPREHCNEFYEVELGFPSEQIHELNEYAENKENHKETVFGYVPIEDVEKLIEKHGGIDADKTISSKPKEKA